jgi:hypothetical protein
MKPVRTIAWLVALLPLAGCSHVWKTSEPTKPVTYSSANDPVKERHVGRLRRLLVLPVAYDHVWEKTHHVDREKAIARSFYKDAPRWLRDWRGYEFVAPWGPDESCADREDLTQLLEWAKKAKPASSSRPPQTPDELAVIVRALCTSHHCDGLLLMHGETREPGIIAWGIAIGSLGIAWPVMLLDSHSYMYADIFEADSGRLVWRCKESDPYENDPSMTRLFEPIEYAIPEVLARGQ